MYNDKKNTIIESSNIHITSFSRLSYIVLYYLGFNKNITPDDINIVSNSFFVRNSKILDDKINIFFECDSVFDKRKQNDIGKWYDDIDKYDIFCGFLPEDKINKPNYIRYPVWLWFESNYYQLLDLPKLSEYLNSIELLKWLKRYNDVLYLTSYINNQRNNYIADIEQYCHIDFPKKQFISHEGFIDYKYSLYIENTQSEGYVTEKAFEGLRYGTIPIYFGNMIEPCFNPDRIITNVDILKDLQSDEDKYIKFKNQRIFTDNAVDYIASMQEKLKNKIIAL